MEWASEKMMSELYQRKHNITEFLRKKVSVLDVKRALAPDVPETESGNALQVPCLTPGHEDSHLDGGSMRLDPIANRWFCFAAGEGGSIFDLWYRMQPGRSCRDRTDWVEAQRGLALLFADLLDTEYPEPGWREAVMTGSRASLIAMHRRTLGTLEPDPDVPPSRDRTGEKVLGWLVPESAWDRVTTVVQLFRPAIARQDIRVLWFPLIAAFGAYDMGWNMLSIARSLYVPDLRVFPNWNHHRLSIDGYRLNSNDPPDGIGQDISVVYAVENPLDYHLLDLVGLPVILGRWEKTRVNRALDGLIAAEPRKVHCLVALFPETSKSHVEYLEGLGPNAPYIPRLYQYPGNTLHQRDLETTRREFEHPWPALVAPDFSSDPGI